MNLSDYLLAERFDPTEPAGFYVPGIDGWHQMNSIEARSYLAQRRWQREFGVELALAEDDEISH